MGKKHKKDPKRWKIKRNRNGREHIDNCSTGYYKTTELFMQVHHIICISCVSDSTIYDQLEENNTHFKFIKNCLAETDWNINDGHNCIGLPLKRAYVDKRAPPDWDKLPCHQVDHNPYYTVKVSEDLKKKVWEPCIEEAEECKFEFKDLKKQLKKRSTAWRNFLVNRGKEEKGTRYCWENRLKIQNLWYIPFSMHPGTPIPRKPPPNWDDFSKSMQKFLKGMFNAIK